MSLHCQRYDALGLEISHLICGCRCKQLWLEMYVSGFTLSVRLICVRHTRDLWQSWRTNWRLLRMNMNCLNLSCSPGLLVFFLCLILFLSLVNIIHYCHGECCFRSQNVIFSNTKLVILFCVVPVASVLYFKFLVTALVRWIGRRYADRCFCIVMLQSASQRHSWVSVESEAVGTCCQDIEKQAVCHHSVISWWCCCIMFYAAAMLSDCPSFTVMICVKTSKRYY